MALLLTCALLPVSRTNAQQCLDSSMQAGGGANAMQGAYGCWDEMAGYPCRHKACYWYRPYTESSQPDVFYNLYVPNNLGDAGAAYPAPYPTPNLVGHTYYTYQPLMPHEFLYHHHRTYHQYYNRGNGFEPDDRALVRLATAHR
jgi:hypothetical protein